MPAAIERSQNWYKCTSGEPEMIHVPNGAISGWGGNIRKGDILTLGQVAGAPNSNYCLQAVATATVIHASTLILGIADMDVIYSGTTIAAGTYMVPIVVPNERTLFRLCLNEQFDAAGTNVIIGAAREIYRNTIATTPAETKDGSKGFYYVNGANTSGTNATKVEVAQVDLTSWETYPSGSSDAKPYAWVRVIPAQRVIL